MERSGARSSVPHSSRCSAISGTDAEMCDECWPYTRRKSRPYRTYTFDQERRAITDEQYVALGVSTPLLCVERICDRNSILANAFRTDTWDHCDCTILALLSLELATDGRVASTLP